MKTLPVLNDSGWLDTEQDVPIIVERQLAYYFASDKDQSNIHEIHSFAYLYKEHGTDVSTLTTAIDADMKKMFKKYLPDITIELSFTKESDTVYNLNLFLEFEYQGKLINLNWLVKHNRMGLVNSIYKKHGDNPLITIFDRINYIDQAYGEHR